jgi:hypothetical protein
MKKLLLIGFLGALLLSAAPVLADDGFYVIGGRYTPGTKISSLPYTITIPGYYYLTGNLYYSGGTGITVNADNVTIDLMGFTLTGTTLGYGVNMNGRNKVEVRNGTMRGWFVAVDEHSDSGSQHRVIGVRAIGMFGIHLHGTNHLIKGCTALQANPAVGSGLTILGTGTISGCTAMNFTYDGQNSYTGYGIAVGSATVSDNVVLGCTGAGAYGIIASGPTTISRNSVINCTTGIDAGGGGSLIGNVVVANIGQTGIVPNTSSTANVLDQNSVVGAGTHYGSGGVRGLNGG